MRIAIAGQTYYPGNNGQAIFTIHLAEGLARAGHEVHVFSPGDSIKYQRKLVNGVFVHMLPALTFRYIHPEAFLAVLPRLAIQRVFENHRPDVIHIQDHYFLSRDVVAVGRQMQIPIMGTNHFLPENILHYLNLVPLPRSLKITILWKLMLWTYDTLRVVTTPTETAAGILRKQNIRVPVVPVSCGVDTQYFKLDPDLDRNAARLSFGFDPQKVLLLYIGRLDREKRIDLLLRAIAILRDRGETNILLAVGGQGAAREGLEGLVKSLHLENQVHFLGYVSSQDLPKLYQAADIFCMPSPEELQSIATLEAMASNRPVLAANARALPELVNNGVNGRLFKPGSPESAADELACLIEKRDLWHRMGNASRARAVAHSLENTIQQYEVLYRRLGGRRRKESLASTDMQLRTAGMD